MKLTEIIKDIVNEVRSSSLSDTLNVEMMSDSQLKRLKSKIDSELRNRKNVTKLNMIDKNLEPIDTDYAQDLMIDRPLTGSTIKKFRGGFFVDKRNSTTLYAKTVKGVLYKHHRQTGWDKVEV